MPRRPPLAAVRVFDCIARLGSLTRAAEELNMTQSAVSYQLKQLEQFAGQPLFVREARGVSLTGAGRQIAPIVRQSLAAIDQAFARTQTQAGSVLVISTLQTIANVWLAPRIGSFQLAHPEIAVRMGVTNEVVDLTLGEADVAIRSGKGDWPGLVSHLLFAQTFTAVASPAYLARHGRPATPADLVRHTLISPSDDWWPTWFEATGVHGFKVSDHQGVDVEFQHAAAVVAASGHGVALVTLSLQQELLKSGRLVQLFDVTANAGSDYYLVYPQANAASRKIRLFRDWALKEADAAGMN